MLAPPLSLLSLFLMAFPDFMLLAVFSWNGRHSAVATFLYAIYVIYLSLFPLFCAFFKVRNQLINTKPGVEVDASKFMLVRVLMAVAINRLPGTNMMVWSLFPPYMRTHIGVPDQCVIFQWSGIRTIYQMASLLQSVACQGPMLICLKLERGFHVQCFISEDWRWHISLLLTFH